MVRHNISRGSMRPDKDQFAVVNYNIDGLDSLWNLAISAGDREVKERAIQFLLEIHVSLWREKKASLPVVARTFVNTTMGLLPKERPEKAKVLETIGLIKRFINQYPPANRVFRFEDFSYAKIDKAEYKGESYVIRKCVVKTADGGFARDLIIKIRESMTIYDLRNAISYYLRKPKSRFAVVTPLKKMLLDARYDNCIIRNASIFALISPRRNRFRRGGAQNAHQSGPTAVLRPRQL